MNQNVTTACVSAIGQGHTSSGVPCQDSGLIAMAENGIVIGAIADGAGTAKHSDVGAKKVCEFTIEFLRAEFCPLIQSEQIDIDPCTHESLALECFNQVVEKLYKYSEQEDLDFRELASTLVAFIATPRFLTSIEVGDSFLIFKEASNNDYQLVSRPTRGEYVNQTIFVTHSPLPEQIKRNVHIFPEEAPLEFICAMTDGMEAVSIDRVTWKPGGQFFTPIHRATRLASGEDELNSYLEQILTMEELNRRSDDDKTILVACFTPE